MPALTNSETKFLKNSIFYLAALFIAVGFKYHYSRAPSDRLGWILSPTAGVVEFMSGIEFEKEDGAGFVSRKHRLIIAPACAGVNFLIIAFSMASFSGIHRFKSFGNKTFWLAVSALGAYVWTIAVNAGRIAGSIYMGTAKIHIPWLAPGQLHRIEGIAIYFFALCLFYGALETALGLWTPDPAREGHKRIQKDLDFSGKNRLFLIPWLWYLLVSVGIPLLNRVYHKNGPRFVEHCLTILAVSMVVFLSLFLIQSCLRRLWSKIQSRTKSAGLAPSTVKDRL